jgi:hypothetical protein
VQCDRAIAETAKHDYENQDDQSCAMLATRSDLFVPTTVDAPFHALVCKQVLFLLDDITMPLPRAITKLLQEFKDVFLPRYS